MASEAASAALERIADALERLAELGELRDRRELQIRRAKQRVKVANRPRPDLFSAEASQERATAGHALRLARMGLDERGNAL